jgi:hypothetical protein
MAVAPLAALALVLFGIAIRSGRWGLWLAGYAAVLAALVVALLANTNRDGRAGAMAPPAAPAASQPTVASGVLDPADRWLAGDEVT